MCSASRPADVAGWLADCISISGGQSWVVFQPVIKSLMFVCGDRSELGLEICYIKIARTETDSDHEGLRQHFFSEQGKVYQII